MLTSSLCIAALSLTLTQVRAQTPVTEAPIPPTAEEIAALAAQYYTVVQQNRQARADYTWQYRTEVWSEEVLQWVDLVAANLDAEGNPVYTQVNRDQAVEQKRGIIRRGSQQKDFEELDEIVKYIGDWVTYYAWMPLSRVTELFDQAARGGAVSIASASGDLLRVEGRNIRDTDAGDWVGLYLHRESASPIQLSFVIPVAGEGDDLETITGTIHYRWLLNGEAYYADHVDITVPSREIRVKVENLNMTKKQ